MSYDAPAGDAPQESRPRGKYWWLRWVLIALAAIVLTVEIVLVWDQLAKAWKSILTADPRWVLACVVAAMASMHSFAQIQRTLLRSAGVQVRQWRSEAAFYAGNALSTTMPGGPVLSATFIYRQQRMWGASPVVASWQLVMSGVLQAVGLALLGLGGAFLLGASKNPLSLIFTLGGFVALLLLAQSVAANPQQIEGIGAKLLSWVNSLRNKPSDTGLEKWRETLEQLESVSLSRRA
ncbi:MAG: rane protein, partial [Mycobacterium sp.]|nr:rane protein [Mycobacterium sp.]